MKLLVCFLNEYKIPLAFAGSRSPVSVSRSPANLSYLINSLYHGHTVVCVLRDLPIHFHVY